MHFWVREHYTLHSQTCTRRRGVLGMVKDSSENDGQGFEPVHEHFVFSFFLVLYTSLWFLIFLLGLFPLPSVLFKVEIEIVNVMKRERRTGVEPYVNFFSE